MPIHDWKRVPAGIFHGFHQHWTVELELALNRGILPAPYYAFIEQASAGRSITAAIEADVYTQKWWC